jgi:hypothetical protein
MSSQPSVEELLQRYASMTSEQFAPLRREDLTPVGQEAYDREVARRSTPEWQAEEAQKEEEYQRGMEEALTGIRGWLILPAIGIVVDLLWTAFEIASNWSRASTAYGDVLRGYFPFTNTRSDFVAAVLLGETLFFVFTAMAAAAFFARKPFAPRLMIAWNLISVGLNAGAYAWAVSLGASGLALSGGDAQLAGQVVSAAIWVPYFVRSQRVRYTFAPKADAA